jgi:hypothetical protein
MIKVSDHPNINAALDDCVATFGDNGGELHLDAATTFAAPATYPCHGLKIRGDNLKAVAGFPSGDILTFKRPDGGEIRNTLLQDFSILTSVARTGGWALRLSKCVRSTTNNVDLGQAENLNMHHGGMWFDGYDDSRLDDCNIYARHKGVLVNGKPDQSYGADLVIGGGTKIANHKRIDMADALPGAVGIHLAGGQGGTYLDTVQAIYCGIGILLDKAIAGVMNREVFLNTGVIVDSCVEDGIRLMEDCVGTFQAVGVWSASNGRGGAAGCGLRAQPGQSPIFDGIVTGGKFYNNAEDGMALSGGDWNIDGGVSIMDNKGYGINPANAQVTGYAKAKFRRNIKGDVRTGYAPYFAVAKV